MDFEFKSLLIRAYQLGRSESFSLDQTDEQILEKIFDKQVKQKTPETLISLLSQVVKSEYIEEWVRKPNDAFGGKTPIYIWYSDREQIHGMILRMSGDTLE